jgi:DNA gyrase/topoisomerase IV subunit A
VERCQLDERLDVTLGGAGGIVPGFPIGPPVPYPDGRPTATVGGVDEREREAARQRLEILRGIQQAFHSWPVVSSLIWDADDRRAALDALQSQLGLSEIAAHYVLDLPSGRTTRQAREDLLEEVNELSLLLQDE